MLLPQSTWGQTLFLVIAMLISAEASFSLSSEEKLVRRLTISADLPVNNALLYQLQNGHKYYFQHFKCSMILLQSSKYLLFFGFDFFFSPYSHSLWIQVSINKQNLHLGL